MVGIRPKQFVDQHDYHVMKEGNIQDTYDHTYDTYDHWPISWLNSK